jgi:hypothetical protein
MLIRQLRLAPVGRTSLFAALALLSGGVSQAQITGSVWEYRIDPALGPNYVATDAVLGYGDPSSPLYLGAPDATFNSGAINYASDSTYTLAPFLNNPTFNNQSANFISNGGGAAGLDNMYFRFTGQVFLNAGNNSFVVGHDDGLQLNIDGIGLVVNAPGPTALDNTPFNVNAPSAGEYTFELSYGECCGAPADLNWDINNQVVGVPDASATMGLLGVGLTVLGAFGRRVKK